jgi:hypothetical protein
MAYYHNHKHRAKVKPPPAMEHYLTHNSEARFCYGAFFTSIAIVIQVIPHLNSQLTINIKKKGLKMQITP